MTRAIDDPTMRGLYHLTSPAPLRNRDVMATFRALLHRKAGLSSPAWLTRMGAPLLGSDAQLALTGRRAHPQRLLDEGFVFAGTDFGATVGRALQRHGSGLDARHQPAAATGEAR